MSVYVIVSAFAAAPLCPSSFPCSPLHFTAVLRITDFVPSLRLCMGKWVLGVGPADKEGGGPVVWGLQPEGE